VGVDVAQQQRAADEVVFELFGQRRKALEQQRRDARRVDVLVDQFRRRALRAGIVLFGQRIHQQIALRTRERVGDLPPDRGGRRRDDQIALLRERPQRRFQRVGERALARTQADLRVGRRAGLTRYAVARLRGLLSVRLRLVDVALERGSKGIQFRTRDRGRWNRRRRQVRGTHR